MFKVSHYNLLTTNGGNVFLANTLSRASLILPEGLFSYFSDIFEVPNGDVDVGALNAMQQKILPQLVAGGFLVGKDRNELDEVKNIYRTAVNDRSSLQLVIAPTMGCNMSCFYCYEHKDNVVLSIENQQKLIALIEDKTSGVQNLSISWHGGEPLLAVDQIEALSSKIKSICDQRQISYKADMTTNGYLLNSDLVRRLKSCSIAGLQITLDGAKQHHDKTRFVRNSEGVRVSSFDTIVQSILNFGDQISIGLRVNVYKKNSTDIFGLIDHLAEKSIGNRISHLYFAPVFNYKPVANRSANSLDAPQYQPLQHVHFTPREFAALEIEFLKRSAARGLPIYSDILKASSSTCVAVRKNALVVDADGTAKKCYHDLGEVSASFADLGSLVDNNWADVSPRFWMDFEPWDDPFCKECALLPVCWGHCPHKTLNSVHREDLCPPMKHSLAQRLPFMLGNPN